MQVSRKSMSVCPENWSLLVVNVGRLGIDKTDCGAASP